MRLLHSIAVLICLTSSVLAIAPLSTQKGKFVSIQSRSQQLLEGKHQLNLPKAVLEASAVSSPQLNDQKLHISPVNEALSGFVVSLATLPKAIAFSTVLGLSPLTGIWTTVAVSLAVTIFGQSPG